MIISKAKRIFPILLLAILSGCAANNVRDPLPEQAWEQIDGHFQKGIDYYLDESYVEAAKYFRLASDGGHAEAQGFLGTLYDNGKGVEQNHKEALKWYRKAANQGDLESQYDMGLIYEVGDGVPQDYKQAADWYLKAAEQGHGEAVFKMGLLYDLGLGRKENQQQALQWYRQAADQGNASAIHNMGAIYYSGGNGVVVDVPKAAKLFKQAAKHGLGISQLALGEMYLFGEGLEIDPVEAYAWAYVATQQQEDGAGEVLVDIKKKLTSEDMQEAQNRADKLCTQIYGADQACTFPEE